MLAQDCPTLAIWCQEMEETENQAQELNNKLSDFGQSLFGVQWIDVVQMADRSAEATEAQRFGFFLNTIVRSLKHLVIYLDNMESLLEGPDNYLAQNEKAIGYYQRAIVIAKEIGDRESEKVFIGNLGNAYRDLG